MRTYANGLQSAIEILKRAGIREAEWNARDLLFYVCGLDFQGYIFRKNQEFLREDYQKYMSLVEQRAGHIPIQYLINRQNFCGLDFYVDGSVLIPRLDTEVLVDHILKEESESASGLDVCTGSGCIAICLKKLGKYERIAASDLSQSALAVARKNADAHCTEIAWMHSDMFANIPAFRYDFIVSNPPYIRSEAIEELDVEVRDYEPRTALDGDTDGLRFYRILANEGRKYLKKDGRMYLEIGYDQADEVQDLLWRAGFYDIQGIKDLAGKDRVIAAKRS